MKSLKGFRIGVLVDYACSDTMSENYAVHPDRRKWKDIKEDQVILKLPIYQHAPRLVQHTSYFFYMNHLTLVSSSCTI